MPSRAESLPSLLAVLLLSLLAVGNASAMIIDVEQDDISVNLSSMSYSTTQSFIPGAAEITGAGIYRTGSTGGDLTLTIWDLPENQGGSPIVSGTAIATSGTGWVDIFWAPASVTPGETYHLVVTAENFTGGISGNFILLGSLANPYPDGFVATSIPFPDWDLAFRTWTPVPEPSTALLISLGLIGLAARRR